MIKKNSKLIFSTLLLSVIVLVIFGILYNKPKETNNKKTESISYPIVINSYPSTESLSYPAIVNSYPEPESQDINCNSGPYTYSYTYSYLPNFSFDYDPCLWDLEETKITQNGAFERVELVLQNKETANKLLMYLTPVPGYGKEGEEVCVTDYEVIKDNLIKYYYQGSQESGMYVYVTTFKLEGSLCEFSTLSPMTITTYKAEGSPDPDAKYKAFVSIRTDHDDDQMDDIVKTMKF